MSSIRIDVQELTPDLFENSDSNVLLDALLVATDPQQPVADCALFQNDCALFRSRRPGDRLASADKG